MNWLINEEMTLEMHLEVSLWIQQLDGSDEKEWSLIYNTVKQNGMKEIKSWESIQNFTLGLSEFEMFTAIQVMILHKKI